MIKPSIWGKEAYVILLETSQIDSVFLKNNLVTYTKLLQVSFSYIISSLRVKPLEITQKNFFAESF